MSKGKPVAAFYQSIHSLFVQAPPEKVYKALTTWHIRAKWRKGIRIKWDGPSEAFPGQHITFYVKGTCLGYAFGFKIAGLEPCRRIYMEYDGFSLKGRSAVEIAPSGSGCNVAFHWMKVEPGHIIARLYFTLGFGMRTHRARTMETLQMLKEYLEKSHESA